MLADWMDVLLLHLIRDPKTIEKLSDKIEPQDISHVTLDNMKGFLWKCSKEYYLQSGKSTPKYFLESKLVDIGRVGGLSESEIESVGSFIDFVYGVPDEQLDSDVAVGYAKRLLDQVRVQTPLQNMLQDGANVSEMFDTFQAGLAAATVSSAEPIDTLASWEANMGTTKPQWLGDTDTEYFNELVHGGLCPGEIALILGPMGGFKTTIAIDMVCAMAKLQQYTAYMSYEQSFLGGDMPIRFMSRLSGVPRDTLISTAFADLPQENKKVIDEAKRTHSKYAMFFDRSQKADKVSDLVGIVRDLESSGRLPRLMIIDQLMTWMGLWPEAGSSKDDWFRSKSTMVIKDLKTQICERYGVNMIVLHQITAAAIGRRGGQTFMHTESAENKSIGFYADFVLTIGTKDETHGIFSMRSGKARRGNNKKVLVQAIPSVCKFKIATDWEESDSGKFIQKGNKNVIPKVQPPGGSPPPGLKGSQIAK